MKFFRAVSILIIVFFNYSYSQFTEFHPELDWYTIKGEHIEVHYHEGAERTARVVAKIADEVWDPITSLYEYEPEKVHFVIKDIDDYSNGATYFFNNKIEIWTSALDFDLRGTHNWLRNVISHEFTHMVQMQASMKVGRTVPAVFLQGLNYEDERRPDILYGFPNFIFSYPIATINMPAWFAEGTAQYMRKEFEYDKWDTHRDMILRSYALDGNLLTWNQMGVFGKTSLGNESVYNSGFALTKYIAQKYGEDNLRKITEALGSWKNFTIDAAFKDVLGKNGDEIYDEWHSFIVDDYKKRIKKVLTNLASGDTLAGEGFGNFYPVFSPNGDKFIYVSNKSSDYFSPCGIYLYDLNTKEEKELITNVRSTLSFIPGTNKILYAKLEDNNPNWYNVHDLYTYDLDNDEEVRLTNDLRANQPSISHDGKKVVFLFQKDGTTNLGMIDINGKDFRQLTFFENGEQVYNPKFSKDDLFIIFDYSYHQTRDIAKINADGTGYKILIGENTDDRNPVFDNKGNLIYASDETGIFNLYCYNMNTKEKKQVTNVTGGAFMPSVDDNGNIIYSGYTSGGYKIFYIKADQQEKVLAGRSYDWIDNPPLDENKPKGDLAAFNLRRLVEFNDYETPSYKQEKYGGVFSKLTVFPFIRYDNYNTTSTVIEKFKPGLYVTSSDMLDRYSIFAGGSINLRWERDLFLIFDYRNKLPLLFDVGLKPEMSLELYSVSRKSDVTVVFDSLDLSQYVNTGVTYNLFEVDLAAKHRIFLRGSDLEFRFIYSQYSATLESFIIPVIEPPALYPSFNDTYFIGRNFQLKYSFNAILPDKDEDINPKGVVFEALYNYESNKLNETGNYTVEDGILKPSYGTFNFHRFELISKMYFPLWWDHTLTAQVRAGSILGPRQPDFFDFYLGGLIGMKAYPFYAISGNEVGWLNLTYRFPLFKSIDARAGHLYLDKIFFSVYGDFGNAWTGKFPRMNNFKKGAGAELRIQMNSYYLFPTSIFFNVSYGFDKIQRIVRNEKITYGKELRFYGGVLFGFDF